MTQERAKQLVEAGLWLRLSGDPEGALRLFEQALKADPANARAREYLAAAQTGAPAVPGPASAPAPSPFVRPPAPPGAPPPPALEGDWGAWAAGPARERTERTLAPDATSAWDSRGASAVALPPGLARKGDALDLVTHDGAAPPAGLAPELAAEVAVLLRGVEDLLELDDHTGAVDLLKKAEELAPGDARVASLRQRSEGVLVGMLEGKLGDLGRVPRVRLKQDEIIWLNLDHRAGFVLAQIDGAVSYEDLFALSGMSRLDTARILVQLLEEGVVDTEPP